MTGGFYRARVVSVSDPRGEGRVRLQVPALFGSAVTGWAEPLFEAETPAVGTRVWAAFEAGDPGLPLFLAPQATIPAGTFAATNHTHV